MHTDPIADLINRIKIANQKGHKTMSVPHSKMKESVLAALKKEGFITDFAKKGKKVQKTLDIDLAFVDGKPKIKSVIRMSKPSRRSYLGVRDIHPIRQGFGRMILTTPKGILSDVDARKERVGGEPLFTIW